MFKTFKRLLNIGKNYFTKKIEFEPVIKSNIITYPFIHLSITDRDKKCSYDLDFRYTLIYKNTSDVKVSIELLPAFVSYENIEVPKIIEGNLSIYMLLSKTTLDLSKLNRSKLLPFISEEFSKSIHILHRDPNYRGIKIINDEFSKNFYYPKIIDELDIEHYENSESYNHVLFVSNDNSVSTNFSDKYFTDESFLLIEGILRRNIPHEYCEIIEKALKGK